MLLVKLHDQTFVVAGHGVENVVSYAMLYGYMQCI